MMTSLSNQLLVSSFEADVEFSVGVELRIGAVQGSTLAQFSGLCSELWFKYDLNKNPIMIQNKHNH